MRRLVGGVLAPIGTYLIGSVDKPSGSLRRKEHLVVKKSRLVQSSLSVRVLVFLVHMELPYRVVKIRQFPSL